MPEEGHNSGKPTKGKCRLSRKKIIWAKFTKEDLGTNAADKLEQTGETKIASSA